MTLIASQLFAGLGAMIQAAENIGFTPGRVVEWAPPKNGRPVKQAAADTLRLHGRDVVNEDVKGMDFAQVLGHVDLLMGGPPCQPFSQSGRNGGHTDERDCVPDFIRAVAETRPRFFIMENVRGLAGPRHRDYLEARVEELRDLGYTVDHRVLDASDYGVGQARKRLFVVGLRRDLGGSVRWPAKVHPKTTMGQALRWSAQTAMNRNQGAPVPARTGNFEDVRWVFERPAPTVVGSFRPDVAATPGYRDAGAGPRQNAKGSVVTTIEERKVLQGLPRDYALAGTQAQQSLQLGNTCPPAIIEAILAANLAAICRNAA